MNRLTCASLGLGLAAALLLSGCSSDETKGPDGKAADEQSPSGEASASLSPEQESQVTTQTDAIRVLDTLNAQKRRPGEPNEVEALMRKSGAPLSDGNTVASYANTKGGFTICVVNDNTQAWALLDSRVGGIVSSGATGADCTMTIVEN